MGDVQIIGPAGPVPVLGVTQQSDTVFTIQFPDQTEPADYIVAAGPRIEDVHDNDMDQNGDKTNGGAEDSYLGAFQVLPTTLVFRGRVACQGGLAASVA